MKRLKKKKKKLNIHCSDQNWKNIYLDSSHKESSKPQIEGQSTKLTTYVRFLGTSVSSYHLVAMSWKIKEIKDFLLSQKQDAKSTKIKKNNIVKFKVLCSRYFYTWQLQTRSRETEAVPVPWFDSDGAEMNFAPQLECTENPQKGKKIKTT